jgi:tRNA pseudouridine55 synthase
MAHQKRVGHAGTLDPAASGVLLVCLGNATRIVEYLVDGRKEYIATAEFGVETDTEDATGSVVSERDASGLTRADVLAILPQFRGLISQIPPMVSAVHHEGKRLYQIAREGRTVERESRQVEIYSLQMLGFTPGAHPTAKLEIECSKGTYIRTLCADIGKALGCGAHMAGLVRTAIGCFRETEAHSLETLETMASEDRLFEALISIDDALSHMPAVTVSIEDVALIRNGVKLPITRLLSHDEHHLELDHPLRIKSSDGELLAIGSLAENDGETVLKPEKVFAWSDAGL